MCKKKHISIKVTTINGTQSSDVKKNVQKIQITNNFGKKNTVVSSTFL